MENKLTALKIFIGSFVYGWTLDKTVAILTAIYFLIQIYMSIKELRAREKE